MILDARKQSILKVIVELYVETGEPVSSKAVEKKLTLSISSATIRNDMAYLAKNHLIEQPHTSAGRIPTDEGYRYYIKNLMIKKELSIRAKQEIIAPLKKHQFNVDGILEKASNMLAMITNYASISTTPSSEEIYSRIELVPAGNKIVILLFMTTDGGVKKQVCRLDFEPTSESYKIFVNSVNRRLSETPAYAITEEFIEQLVSEQGKKMLTFSPVLFALYEIADEVTGGEIILEGEINLLNHKELVGNAKIILEFLDHQENLKSIINSDSGSSLSVLIGSDIKNYKVPNIGMITNKYHIGSISKGSLGVIGPSRMDYGKTIPYVEYIADTVSLLLTEAIKEDNTIDFNEKEKEEK